MTAPSSPAARTLAAAALLLVLYGGLCKALLYRGLEYYHTDFVSFLQMSRSLLESGELLRDNVYGHHAAIHNFYLLLAFAPLTLAFGAYGLILGLVLLHATAVLRVALAPSLDLASRVAVLGGSLGPFAWAVFDNPVFGFHPELCYPPLCVLLALDLREGKPRRAILLAALVALVKEDGAVLLFSVLAAHFAARLWALRAGPAAERRAVAARAAASLAAATLVFALGMALLWWMGRSLERPQEIAEVRVADALRNVGHALAGRGLLRENLLWGLLGYAAVALVTLVPLGRRAFRGLALLALSAPPLVAVLVVSAGSYRFRYMLWPHRVAALLALAAACLVLASPAARAAGRRAVAVAIALVALSWTIQLLALERAEGYAPAARFRAAALIAGEGTRAGRLPPSELRFLRCLAARLPPGLPVSAAFDLHPVFHRQSVVVPARLQYARQPARLRVVLRGDTAPRPSGFCRGPEVGTLAVEAECGLLAPIEACRQEPPGPRG